jgi:hypothetical protein
MPFGTQPAARSRGIGSRPRIRMGSVARSMFMSIALLHHRHIAPRHHYNKIGQHSSLRPTSHTAFPAFTCIHTYIHTYIHHYYTTASRRAASNSNTYC